MTIEWGGVAVWVKVMIRELQQVDRPLDHFRLNLRQLINSGGSISEACRDLDINRQQMAKYLSGESLPSVPLLIKIANHYGVSADIAHKPLFEVMARDDDKLLTLLQGFLRGPFAASRNEKQVSSPLKDGYYMMWQPSVWRTGLVAKQVTKVTTYGAFQYLRHCSPLPLATGQRLKSRNYSMTFSLGDNTQFVLLTFFRRRGVNSWAVSLFREPGYMAAPHLVGVTIGACNLENFNMVGTARVMLERLDMTGQSLISMVRSCGTVPATEVPPQVLRHLRYEAGVFPDIITPF